MLSGLHLTHRGRRAHSVTSDPPRDRREALGRRRLPGDGRRRPEWSWKGIVDAEIALRLGELELAEIGFARALEDATGNNFVRALAGLGEATSRRGLPHEAINYFERAVDKSGADAARVPAIAECLGRAYGTVGRTPEAIEIFRRCLAEQRAVGGAIQLVRFACLLGYALTDNAELGEAEAVVADALENAVGITDP